MFRCYLGGFEKSILRRLIKITGKRMINDWEYSIIALDTVISGSKTANRFGITLCFYLSLTIARLEQLNGIKNSSTYIDCAKYLAIFSKNNAVLDGICF